MAYAAKEAVWLRYLFEDLKLAQKEPTILYGGNMAALAIARDPQYHAKSKHFDVKSHYIRSKICEKIIKEIYCPTDKMIADVLTKPLAKPSHQKLSHMMGMSPD